MSKRITPPHEWVDNGVPAPSGKPSDRDRYIRWVAMIQEDAVKCYETTAVIEDLEQAVEQLEKEVYQVHHEPELQAAFSHFLRVFDNLKKLKVPSENETENETNLHD